jgi:RNA recognition motif-containing protein
LLYKSLFDPSSINNIKIAMSNISYELDNNPSNIRKKNKEKKKRKSSKLDTVDDEPAINADSDTTAERGNVSDDNHVHNGESGDENIVKKKRIRKRQKVKQVPLEDTASTKVTPISLSSFGLDNDESEVDRTIYMEGIPFHATYQQINDFLTRPVDIKQQQGSVEQQRTSILSTEIVDIRLPIWQDTGRYRGYGHVVFSTIEVQQFAIQYLHQKYFFDTSDTNTKNRYISISQAKTKKSSSSGTIIGETGEISAPTLSEPSKTIVLRNLSYQASEEDIYTALNELNNTPTDTNSSTTATPFTIPSLESGQIRIVRHTIPPYRSKGLAYVTFPTTEDATKCIETIHNLSLSICNRRITHYDYDHGRIKGSFRTAQHTFWTSTYGKNNQS